MRTNPSSRAGFLPAFLLAAVAVPAALAQDGGPVAKALFDTLEWRSIGPFRGGRAAAVAGIPSQRDTYWFGSCGGGVWKTTDGGKAWTCVSDGTFGGSIGAVAVSESNPDIVYVGCGEKTVRGNVSSGDGLYKSTDAGKTWEFIGLPESRHVPRIRIHPTDPDLVYAAVLGHISGPNPERGVFRSRNGGKTWERVLFANEHAGAIDLCFEPGNPKVLYASTWRVARLPHTLESGGDGSALWKSSDGGDRWERISGNEGFPKGTLGIIGISVSPAKPDRVYAIVEAEEGGLCRSDDGGKTWRRVNGDRALRQRAWYYSRCYADPKDADTVYVVNVQFHKSTDGGRTTRTIRTPHGDNHDLWIDPNDPQRMVQSNDGGANVSYDGGRTWSPQDNQPTAQFYRVTTDNHVPYRVYGAQQDNSTVRILSRTDRGSIGRDDWESTAGGESGHIAPKPDDPEQVWGGSYGGYLQYVNHRTGERRSVNVWPDNPLGDGAIAQKYRFQWNFPIFFSPHDPDLLYAAGNVLFATRNGGQSWTALSGDLTRNDPQKLQSSGGPITKDNTGVEVYCTIFAALESPHQKGVLWCGSDDGLLHVSRDGGKSWANVTPPTLAEWTQINSIEAHPFEPGGLYVAGTRYKLDDFKPYLWATTDFGKTWREITAGLDPAWFTRVVRADPMRQGLLYCGTERGTWVSFDDGRRWQSLRLNLPITPITDLAVRGDELIAATQGRSFWILNGLDHLRQLTPESSDVLFTVFRPTPAVLGGGGGFRGFGAAPASVGQNPDAGVVVRFLLDGESGKAIDDEVLVEFKDTSGQTLRRYSTKGKPERRGRRGGDDEGEGEGAGDGDDGDVDAPLELDAKGGMNKLAWDGRVAGAKGFKGMVLWSGIGRGPEVPPGEYTVRVSRGDEAREATFQVLKDARWSCSDQDLVARFRFAVATRDLLTRTHEGIERLRRVRDGIDATLERGKGVDGIKELENTGRSLKDRLTKIEETLYQTKAKSSQDVLNFPIRLNDKLANVMNAVIGSAGPPTEQAEAVRGELSEAIVAELDQLDRLLGEELDVFNALAAKKGVPHVK
jgi:photosystem II stability/assembly factor-like uncharacterized protein